MTTNLKLQEIAEKWYNEWLINNKLDIKSYLHKALTEYSAEVEKERDSALIREKVLRDAVERIALHETGCNGTPNFCTCDMHLARTVLEQTKVPK